MSWNELSNYNCLSNGIDETYGIVTKTVHKTLPRGGGAPGGGYSVTGGGGGPGGGGLFDMKLTLSEWHNCLKLKMII